MEITITEVTELDWMMQVTPVPVAQASRRLSVTEAIMRRSRAPATPCIPSDMFFMPNRNRANPPTTRENMAVKSNIWLGRKDSITNHPSDKPQILQVWHGHLARVP